MLHSVSQFEYSEQLNKLLAVHCKLRNILFMFHVGVTYWTLLL